MLSVRGPIFPEPVQVAGEHYSLSVRIRLGNGASVEWVLEHGPSRNHSESLTSESAELGIVRGLIVTQIVWHPAWPLVLKNTLIESCFVSPFQYGLALYQRWMTLGSTVARKTLRASLTHWAIRAPLSN